MMFLSKGVILRFHANFLGGSTHNGPKWWILLAIEIDSPYFSTCFPPLGETKIEELQ